MSNVGDRVYTARIDLMPGSNNTITVTGQITVPTTGWHAYLEEAVPPGINPAILILNLRLVKPSGKAGDMVSTIEAKISKPHGKQYKQVTIHEGAKSQTIDVEEVH